MKQFIVPSFLASALVLSACGGGGDSSGSTATASNTGTTSNNPQQITKLFQTAQVIEYYGDSTIRGYESGTGRQVATSAPDAFSQALLKQPGASKQTTVVNRGVDGQTACELLNADSGWANVMAASNATVVILNHGINDSRGDVGESVSSYKNCLTSLATGAMNARIKKRVIFETPNPVDSTGLDSYVTAMREVAAANNIPVIDQFKQWNDYMATNKVDIRTLVPDGTHPSQDFYIKKGQYAESVYVTLPL